MGKLNLVVLGFLALVTITVGLSRNALGDKRAETQEICTELGHETAGPHACIVEGKPTFVEDL